MCELVADPAEALMPAAGGVVQHALVNPTEVRAAFKVRCSDNALIRVRPTFGFVEPGTAAGLGITRKAGAAKDDRLVIQFADAPPDAADPAAVIAASVPRELRLPICAQ